MTPGKDPAEVVAMILQSLRATGDSGMQCSELGKMFRFESWTAHRREEVTKLFAAREITVRPQLAEANTDDWIELSWRPIVTGDRVASDKNIGITADYVILASTLGPLVTAFCTELGKRFGGTISDWLSRVHVHPRKENPDAADIVVESNGAVTTLEITQALTDEMKLALLDLDINDQSFHGRKLRWDVEEEAWVTADPSG